MSSSTVATGKRKGVSKKNKKSWRKSTNFADVEDFLDDQRLEERLGGSFSEKLNEELFVVDNKSEPENTTVLTKKQKSKLPPRCFEILKPLTSVPDPISKRNRVRTKVERQCSLRKLIEETKRKNGIVKKKDIIAKQSRKLTKELKKNVPKRGEFMKDVWMEDDNEKGEIAKAEWLEDETRRHLLKSAGQLKVRHPKSFVRNPLKRLPSTMPATEAPHPGTSYNPTLSDHQRLLKEVAEKEYKVMKEEEHLKRVTSNMFSAVSAEENHELWLTEMSQGLDKTRMAEDDVQGDYEALNPPTSFTKKKTLKARRKQKEARKAALELKHKRVEKKKTADLYKLRLITKEIEEKQLKHMIVKAKREKKQIARENGPRKLSKRKFEEPDVDFNRPHEIAGNLRALKPEGSILTDRFFSMQKRNILEVTAKQLKCHKRKVKKFTKASHKIEELSTKTLGTKKR